MGLFILDFSDTDPLWGGEGGGIGWYLASLSECFLVPCGDAWWLLRISGFYHGFIKSLMSHLYFTVLTLHSNSYSSS